MSFSPKHKLSSVLLALTLTSSVCAYAEPVIKLLKSKHNHAVISSAKISQLVKQNFDVNQYKKINVQAIYNGKNQVDHFIIYLFSKKYHRVDLVCMNVDVNFRVISVQKDYRISKSDSAQQPGITAKEAKCPDPEIQFIAFAPNDDDFEIGITKEVADAAEKHSLKTIRLLKDDATRENYLNYMSCPKLVGNFYDGDADPELITTADGELTYGDIESVLKNQFKYKVTNIWLACEAFNDPIKTSMLDIAQSQKYAAGVNNLEVGPSDKAAACAMEAALDGKPMTESFNACYDKLDTKEDIWGFDGKGTDIFGT